MPKIDRPAGNAGLTHGEANAKRDGRLERELQNQIANWLRLKGIFFVRSRMDKKTTVAPGTPDFVFCIVNAGGRAHPIPVALEVKTRSGMSTVQNKVREQMEDNGWHYYVVGSLRAVIDLYERETVGRTF
jgi:hypothetical protein